MSEHFLSEVESIWPILIGVYIHSSALECPDRSSPRNCVDSGSNSCPALLQPGSPVADCSESCQCDHGNVFEGGKCVPYSQCGCVLGDKYIKVHKHHTDSKYNVCFQVFVHIVSPTLLDPLGKLCYFTL